MISVIVTPQMAGDRRAALPPLSRPRLAEQPSRTNGIGRNAALAEEWEEAVVGFLRQRRREAVPYWEVVNAVAIASRQLDRWEHRFATKGILHAVKALLHGRRILRYRRRYLSILDLGWEVVPLDVYRAMRSRAITG